MQVPNTLPSPPPPPPPPPPPRPPQPPSKKKKKSIPEKISPELELSSSNIKKFLKASQKKAFLIFPEMEPCTFHIESEK